MTDWFVLEKIVWPPCTGVVRLASLPSDSLALWSQHVICHHILPIALHCLKTPTAYAMQDKLNSVSWISKRKSSSVSFSPEMLRFLLPNNVCCSVWSCWIIHQKGHSCCKVNQEPECKVGKDKQVYLCTKHVVHEVNKHARRTHFRVTNCCGVDVHWIVVFIPWLVSELRFTFVWTHSCNLTCCPVQDVVAIIGRRQPWMRKHPHNRLRGHITKRFSSPARAVWSREDPSPRNMQHLL